jgi:hypothetical protein
LVEIVLISILGDKTCERKGKRKIQNPKKAQNPKLNFFLDTVFGIFFEVGILYLEFISSLQ